MKDCGDFRDPKFRDYLIDMLFSPSFPSEDNLLKILNKERITDGDLIQIYLSLNKLNEVLIDKLFFNYKMWTISSDRISKFLDIAEAKTSIITDRAMGGMINGYYFLKGSISNESVFQELVDIFLDEI